MEERERDGLGEEGLGVRVVLKIFYEIKLRKFYIRIYDNTARQNTGL
jgi:hypothetical protein